MDNIRIRDRVIIKLPKVMDYYLGTITRHEEGKFYVWLDRGDGFYFKDSDLIVERGIDKICPELITSQSIYKYILGIGDRVYKPSIKEQIAELLKLQEIKDVLDKEKGSNKQIVDIKKKPEESRNENSGESESEEDESQIAPDTSFNKEDNIKNEESEEDESQIAPDTFFNKEDNIKNEEDESQIVPDTTMTNEKSSRLLKKEVPKESEEDESQIVSQEVNNEEEIDNVKEKSKKIHKNEDNLEENPDEVVNEEETNEETDRLKEATLKSNINTNDGDVDYDDEIFSDNANTDSGDINETDTVSLLSSILYKRGDRVIVKRGRNKYFLGTVTMYRGIYLYINFDSGEKFRIKPASSLIIGKGIETKYPNVINGEQLSKFLDINFIKPVKENKVELTVIPPYVEEGKKEPKSTKLSEKDIDDLIKEEIDKGNESEVPNIKLPDFGKKEYRGKLTEKDIDDIIS